MTERPPDHRPEFRYGLDPTSWSKKARMHYIIEGSGRARTVCGSRVDEKWVIWDEYPGTPEVAKGRKDYRWALICRKCEQWVNTPPYLVAWCPDCKQERKVDRFTLWARRGEGFDEQGRWVRRCARCSSIRIGKLRAKDPRIANQTRRIKELYERQRAARKGAQDFGEERMVEE